MSSSLSAAARASGSSDSSDRSSNDNTNIRSNSNTGAAGSGGNCLIVDKTVERVALAVPRPFFLRLDTTPFLALYAAAITASVVTDGNASLFALIAIPAIVFLHGVLLLTMYWSYPTRLRIAFKVIGGSATAPADAASTLAAPVSAALIAQTTRPSAFLALSSDGNNGHNGVAGDEHSLFGSIFTNNNNNSNAPSAAAAAATTPKTGTVQRSGDSTNNGATVSAAEARAAYLYARTHALFSHETWALYIYMLRLKKWEATCQMRVKVHETLTKKFEVETAARAQMTPQQLGARPAPKPPAPLALPDRPLPPPLPVTPFLLHSQRALAQLARAPPSSMEAISAVVGKYDGVVGWIQWSLGLASDAPLPVYIYIKPHEHQGPESMEKLVYESLTQSAADTAAAIANNKNNTDNNNNNTAVVAAGSSGSSSVSTSAEVKPPRMLTPDQMLEQAAKVTDTEKTALTKEWNRLSAAVKESKDRSSCDLSTPLDADDVPALIVTHTHKKYYWSLSLKTTDPLLTTATTNNNSSSSARIANNNISFSSAFLPVVMPESGPLAAYLAAPHALSAASKRSLPLTLTRYGANSIPMQPPSFFELLVQHAMAPFFVFQMFCIALWCLDEYWYYSLFTLFMLVLFESMVIFRRISQTGDLLTTRPPVPSVWSYRDGAWVAIAGDDIVPGDIISIPTLRTAPPYVFNPAQTLPSASASAADSAADVSTPLEHVVPCDAVLLHGSAVVNEAILTGESLPQVKDGLWDADDVSDMMNALSAGGAAAAAAGASVSLDLATRHRRHALFAGTKVLMVTDGEYNELNSPYITNSNNNAESSLTVNTSELLSLPPPPPDSGLPAVAVRTGFTTTQGSLLRTIIASSSSSSSSSSPEALAFIGVLLICACVSAYYVLDAGLNDPNRSRYKLMLNVITILTSVVPPELPMQLSLAVNYSLAALVKEKVYCTEPFRIPDAGGVDVCCFDKTGTLTEDEFVVVGISGVAAAASSGASGAKVTGSMAKAALLTPDQLSDDVRLVLGACHSLMRVPAPAATKKAAATATASDASQTATAHNNNNNSDSNANSNAEWEVVGDPMEKVAMQAARLDFSNMRLDFNTPAATSAAAASTASSLKAKPHVDVLIGPSNARLGLSDSADNACASVSLPNGNPPRGAARGLSTPLDGASDGVTVRHAGGGLRARVLHRYPFSSNLKRMSVLIALEHSTATTAPGDATGRSAATPAETPVVRVLCKGAPETLLPLFAPGSAPDAATYGKYCQYWALKGCRVLALGYRDVVYSKASSSGRSGKTAKTAAGWCFDLPSNTSNSNTRDHSDDVAAVQSHVSPSLSPFHPPPRATVEGGLIFAGFLVLRTPLKRDSKAVIETLKQSSHQCVMITGDHVLTAVHVAKELGMVQNNAKNGDNNTADDDDDDDDDGSSANASHDGGVKPVLLLEKASSLSSAAAKSSALTGFVLTSLDGTYVSDFDLTAALSAANATTTRLGARGSKYLDALATKYDLAVTGSVLEAMARAATASASSQNQAASAASSVTESGAMTDIVSVAPLSPLFPYVTIFARTMPDQKEGIVAGLKSLGKTTLMCGDGTNDVGALKQAHVGVALLSADLKSNASSAAAAAAAEAEAAAAEERRLLLLPAAEAAHQRAFAAVVKTAKTNPTLKSSVDSIVATRRQAAAAPEGTRERDELLAKARKMEEAMIKMHSFLGSALTAADEPDTTAKFGDASISAPFTAKHSSVKCVLDIIRQGRCTLVTTMQMYQILALNCLISAYSMSALYLKGIKMGETQMTISGMGTAFIFMALSWAQPVKELSPERPYARIFSPWMVLTVLLQFSIHLFSLVTAVNMALPHTPTDSETLSPEGKFAPNLLNTTVWLVSTAMTVATFLANYRGRPFMQSLTEHAPLKKMLFGLLGLIAVLALEVMPDINLAMELVPSPSTEYQLSLCALIAFDVIASVGVGKGLTRYFAKVPEQQQQQTVVVEKKATGSNVPVAKKD